MIIVSLEREREIIRERKEGREAKGCGNGQRSEVTNIRSLMVAFAPGVCLVTCDRCRPATGAWPVAAAAAVAMVVMVVAGETLAL